ncbi:hypothetical protein QNI19_00860 [Cytophagaceae bacterium DM2B3-1]|uniref:PE-PGRS family protein n=1 Tax=Xanthocytophaga flava TaxID=3048013 RepID=A0ABT7CCN9_9BACT|nr:hypothetical protein [Xanthocytophaga flavus]MDJ1491456.1 hypothetical protein [Xanthocytophaga flavus]
MKRIFTHLLCLCIVGMANPANAQFSDSVKISLEKEKLVFPGNTLSIGFSFVSKEGKVSQTKGLLNGKIPWRKLYIESSIEPRIRNGVLHIPHDLALIKQKSFTIRVYDRKKKTLYSEIPIPYDFPVAIKPELPDDFVKAPGFNTPFALALQWSDGSTSVVNQKRGGMISLADFNYRVEGGEIKRNHLYIWPDAYAIPNHTVAVYAYGKDFPIPESDAVSFKLDYKAKYSYNTSASDGRMGFSGSSGSNGSSECHGGNGGWGSPGENGEPGHDIKVTVDAYFDDILQTTLVDAKVTDLQTGRSNFYRIDAAQGNLFIRVRGGDGGRGGSGGNGGDGGAGVDGKTETKKKKVNDSTYVDEVIRHPGTHGGNGGDGGNGAPGGHGGDGGNIYIYHTKAAEPYLHVIKAISVGGSGGWGGSGGSAGSGGRGGSGEPSGRSGSNGRPGMSGFNGSSGRRGEVVYYRERE